MCTPRGAGPVRPSATHRATRPGARLYLFEAGSHNVNGIQAHGLPAQNFERMLPAAGWRIDYLGPTAYRAHMTPEGFAEWLAHAYASGWGARVKPLQEQLRVIAAEKPPAAHAVLGGDRDSSGLNAERLPRRG